ncbi:MULTISPECIES: hypothetical protein [unclassified Pedobacter]|uniref:hypothetical protein n=1 Tax=unclassified Pedobacter TaxID=2628915 RepID=UPI001E579A4F|nr:MULTISPECIES: hypothetical protein [unclassified Pedobacter]
MNTNKENSGGSNKEHKANIDLDNDTYGHSSNNEAFKRKDEPAHDGEDNIDASGKLKDKNLTESDDLSSRNKGENKGIGGKEQ